MVNSPKFLTKLAMENEAIDVLVIGAGGTGSMLLHKLFQMHNVMRGLGGEGLRVTVMDDDCVSESNIGRQTFYPFDIALNKAEVLVNRFNTFGGVNWKAIAENYNGDNVQQKVVFGCVDNVESRIKIHKALVESDDEFIWIDAGNTSRSGNIIMGMQSNNEDKPLYLPTVYDLFRIQMDSHVDVNVDSCSHEDAIFKQDLGVNDIMAFQAVQMLWQLFRHGNISYHGMSVDLKTGVSVPLKPCKDEWAMYGYEV